MIKLKKPKFNQESIINDCISNMIESESKSRILKSKTEIIEKSSEYDKLAIEGRLTEIQVHNKLGQGATKDDIISLYDNKFSKKGQIARKYYDEIRLLAPYGRCPICGQRQVKTLDHYIPKSKFPTYAITPFNLVPACSDCNKEKTSDIAHFRNEETINPYYDNFEDEIWISAKVIETIPVCFDFFVIRPDKWDDEKYMRAQAHFDKFHLNDLYKPYASEMFVSTIPRLVRLYKAGGEELTKEEVKDCIKDEQKNRLNTWQAAMYKAILDSKWFWEKYILTEIS